MLVMLVVFVFFFKQKTAYEMRISDWSSDVCSSDLLVREALQERERLLAAAPHMIYPMRFVLPHVRGIRPWWVVRLGLLLYDRIGGKSRMPGSRGLRPWDRRFQAPLKRTRAGFVYSDCVVDDSRLTLLNAMDAAQRGGDIKPRTELSSARREGNIWHAELSNGVTAKARVLANAAGPWVTETLARIGAGSKARVRLVKGR